MAIRTLQRGVTLIELMVAMAIGLVIVLAASVAFLAGKNLFSTDADVQAVQDSLRFTRHVVQSLIRQAGYEDYAPDPLSDGTSVIASKATLQADPGNSLDLDIAGASNTVVNSTSDGFGVNDSDLKLQNDSLMVRFFGRSKSSGEADGTMIDCLGIPQAGPVAQPSLDDRAWSFFFVALASDGEPELYCKYRTKGEIFKFALQPVARGVEKFKVVYGHDSDGNGVPEAWLDAKGIAAKASGAAAVNDEWRKVVAVRVGMVIRSTRPNWDLKRIAGEDYRLYPLGEAFKEVFFDPPDDGRFRSVAAFTVMLRNVVRDPA